MTLWKSLRPTPERAFSRQTRRRATPSRREELGPVWLRCARGRFPFQRHRSPGRASAQDLRLLHGRQVVPRESPGLQGRLRTPKRGPDLRPGASGSWPGASPRSIRGGGSLPAPTQESECGRRSRCARHSRGLLDPRPGVADLLGEAFHNLAFSALLSAASPAINSGGVMIQDPSRLPLSGRRNRLQDFAGDAEALEIAVFEALPDVLEQRDLVPLKELFPAVRTDVGGNPERDHVPALSHELLDRSVLDVGRAAAKHLLSFASIARSPSAKIRCPPL